MSSEKDWARQLITCKRVDIREVGIDLWISCACLARGVPLAIAADDGALYFPADGNQRLKTLLNARVRASGTLVEKHEPMELKMPVGDKNQMVVRFEGGYKQITIETLEKIPAEKRCP